jgi:potassium efflux system protein
MRAITLIIGVFLGSLLIAAATVAAPSVPDAVPSLPAGLSRERVVERLSALADDASAPRELLTEALTLLDRRAQLVERAVESARRAAEAEPLLAEIRRELETPLETVRPEVASDATLSQIEQRASEISAELDLARVQAADLAAEASRRQERRTTIPDAIAQARQRLNDLDAAPAPPPESEGTTVQDARSIRDAAERASLEAEVAALQAELSEYDARRELLPARRDRAARRVARAEQTVQAWQSVVSAKRKQEAEREAQEAARRARETEGQHPVLRAYADRSRELAEQRTLPTGLPQRTTGARDEANAADAALREIRSQYRAVRERIVASGLTRATGLLLRRHYDELKKGITNPEALRRRTAQVRRDLEQAEAQRFEREDARDAYRDIGPVVDDLLAEARDAPEAIGNEDAARAVARDLASARRDLLTTLQNDASGYAGELAALERSLSTLLEAVEAYESYIRERILWVRSVPRETTTDLSELTGAVGPLAEGGGWREAGRVASSHAQDRWPALLVGASLFVLLFIAVRWANARLRAAAEQVARYRTDSFTHTLEALVFTAAGALPSRPCSTGRARSSTAPRGSRSRVGPSATLSRHRR